METTKYFMYRSFTIVRRMISISMVHCLSMINKLLTIAIIISTLTTTIYAQTIHKSLTLTPSNTAESGASILPHLDEVSSVVYPIVGLHELVWQVDIASQDSWQFILILDETWGFSPNAKDTIEITINSPSVATGSATDTFDTLVFGFTTDNQQYFSTRIPMNNNGERNTIYPECDIFSDSTQTFGTGDIANLPSTGNQPYASVLHSFVYPNDTYKIYNKIY